MSDPNILIIGGGIIGLSIARELHTRGVSGITVAESGRCGEASSWAAAGMLGPQAEATSRDTMMDMCLESRALYPEFADELRAETGIDPCLDTRGTFHVAFDEKELEPLALRTAWQRDAGLRAEMLSAKDMHRMEPFISPDAAGCAHFPDDWQVDNRKLLDALKRSVEIAGVTVLEGTRVTGLINERGKIGGAISDGGEIAAGMTIVAAGAWTSLIRLGAFPLPVHVKPIRGQMIAYRTAKRLFEHVIYSSEGYLVPRADGRILAGATSEDVGFVTENTISATSELSSMAERIAPGLACVGIMDKWAGLRPYAADGHPVIGQFAGLDNILIATAHYRNGILLAPLTARIIADKITSDSSSVYLDSFGPDRFQATGATAK